MPQPAASTEPPRSAKWHQRRQGIVDRSAKVIAQRGYHATSTTELCQANRLGKGALYYYIGSKERLLVAIHDRVMDEVMIGADRVAEAGGSPPERLTRLGDALLDVIARYPDHVWVFLHEFPALTAENAAAVPRPSARVRDSASRTSSRPGSRRATSGPSTPSSPRGRGSACTTTRTCG